MFIRTVCVTTLLLAPACGAALAQTAGTYAGSTADGQNVSFSVTQDATSGDYSITAESISFSAPCKNSSTTLNTAWGLGSTVAITKGVAKLALQDNYFFFSGTLHFSGTTLSGTLASTSPDLSYNASGHPAKALYCVSPAQSVTATLAPDSASAQRDVVRPKAVLFRSQSVSQPAR